jgi:hypothetical protein
MACELFYDMSRCLCSGLVELIVIVQAHHIKNREYSNSYTINDVLYPVDLKPLLDLKNAK